MPIISESIDAAIKEVATARLQVSKIKGKQVRGVDTVATLSSTAYAWFNTHRRAITAQVPTVDLAAVDSHYKVILDSTAKCAAKQTYLDALKDAKRALIALRAIALTAPITPATANTDDLAPDFSPLAGNQEMRDILTRRWHECCKCVNADAHLAAIVMMGGLLEALFVARANKMSDKNPLISASAAPKDTLAAGHFKGRATKALLNEGLWGEDRGPVWGRGCWAVFLEGAEDVRRAVKYVEGNPGKEGKARQRWSFVTEYLAGVVGDTVAAATR